VPGDFTVHVEGHVAEDLALISRGARQTIMLGVMEGAHVVEREAKLNAERNFPQRIGMMPTRAGDMGLRKSIHTERKDADLAALVGPSVIYGRIREFGGVILPVHKKFLSWWTMEPPKGLASDVKTRKTKFSYRSKKSIKANIGWAAHRVFAKRVKQEGKPYLVPALQDNAARIVSAIEARIRKLMEERGAA
jgi:phage gpG-like protein